MSDTFSMQEFIQSKEQEEISEQVDGSSEETLQVPNEIDVQKAVVESLAADKAVQNEKIELLKKANEELELKIAELEKNLTNNLTAITERDEKIRLLSEKISEQNEALGKVGDVLSKNAESELSNKVALLDRETSLPDRFPGETRDHVLEVIQEARDRAENEGRLRRAQLLEGVLVANETNGNLAKKRQALMKFFNENGNIVSGIVMAELDRCGIQYKCGKDKNGNDNYLMPAEILTRNY